jgi:hypothetical protein
MTKQTRYFMAGSAAVLAAGLCTGLVAYYSGGFQPLSASAVPDAIRYVPSDSTVVAYADIRAIMDSEFRMRLKQVLPMNERGQEEFQRHTGIDIERDVDYVVAAMTALPAAGHPSGLVVVRGRFNDAQLETLAREHGGGAEDYRGKRLVSMKKGDGSGSLAFLEPGLVAVGESAAIKKAIDAQMSAASITANSEMMDLVKDIDKANNNAWAVGRFDVLASRANLPEQVARQIPAVKWFAAAAHINGGIAGMLRAEARDDQSAENLRDIVRGLLALGRMQAQAEPRAAGLVESLQLSGTGKTVQLSFTLPAELLELLPKPPANPGRQDHELGPELHERPAPKAPEPPQAPRPPQPQF